MKIRKSRPCDGDRTFAIWRASVIATHDFLTPQDLEDITAEVRQFLPGADLWLAVDDGDSPIGFMGLTDANIDALFIDPATRGKGVGRALIAYAGEGQSFLTTEVNEQNAQAVGFYERMGFVATERSPTDRQGRPYPLIHLLKSQ